MIVHTGTQDARAVANYFLDLAKRDGRSIDPMGIQKLVYLAHGWNLALYGRPLIAQPVEAWEYGPVIRVLYHEFKKFGNGPITAPATEVRFEPGTMRLQVVRPELEQGTSSEASSLLDRVWDVYKGFTSIQLSNMTHVPGSPWSVARSQNQSFINEDTIRAWFSAQMNVTD